MKRFTPLFIFIFLFAGCVEFDQYDLKLKDAEPRLVVEGLVTNQPGPYYIHLTKSKTGAFVPPDNNYYSNAEPITDAIVIISDDSNQLDTLKLIEVGVHSDSLEYLPCGGFYKTSSLKGISGHTYFMKVIHNGRIYSSSAYMPPVPEIDSLGYYLNKVEIVGKSDYYLPLLYFKEPQGIKNYYLIQLNNDLSSRIYSSNNRWQFSILSDEFLKPYVNGLNVSPGATPEGINYSPVYWPGDSIYVALSSLTKEGYSYYKALLDQFDNDGGAYKPTPASPPGNISNGGLGLFRASAVSEKRIKIPDHSN
jgi:hypothetical protein